MGADPIAVAFDGLTCAFDECAMGESTERYNDRYGLTREEQDIVSARSDWPNRRPCREATVTGVPGSPAVPG